MRKVALKLNQKNVAEVITLGENVAKGLDGNPNFPAPPVTPAALTAASGELEEAHEEWVATRSRQSFATRQNKLRAVKVLLQKLALYVDGVAQGDVEIILSANMPVSKAREKQPAPEQVSDLAADFTGIPGSILLRWKKARYARQYRVYMSSTPEVNGSWQLIDTIEVRKMMVSNLASGKRFYFRVVAVGTSGVGPDSEIAEAIAA